MLLLLTSMGKRDVGDEDWKDSKLWKKETVYLDRGYLQSMES
jgi:hypothetical protein